LALDIPPQPPCELECTIETVDESADVLRVNSRTPTFGPQPWLALKTATGKYHFDNFDIDVPFHSWQYVFDQETFPLSALSAIGVAANNAYGITTAVRIDPDSRESVTRHWNLPIAPAAEVPANR
jgi:hypothetical protein